MKWLRKYIICNSIFFNKTVCLSKQFQFGNKTLTTIDIWTKQFKILFYIHLTNEVLSKQWRTQLATLLPTHQRIFFFHQFREYSSSNTSENILLSPHQRIFFFQQFREYSSFNASKNILLSPIQRIFFFQHIKEYSSFTNSENILLPTHQRIFFFHQFKEYSFFNNH